MFGVEAQLNWSDFSGQNVSTLFPGQLNRSRVQAFGLFTGQVGYAWNNMLFYVKGGGAVVDDRYEIFVASGFPGAGTQLANAIDEPRGVAPWELGLNLDSHPTGPSASNTTTSSSAAVLSS